MWPTPTTKSSPTSPPPPSCGLRAGEGGWAGLLSRGAAAGGSKGARHCAARIGCLAGQPNKAILGSHAPSLTAAPPCLPYPLPCRSGKADFADILARYAVPGAGRIGDPAATIPAGWVYDPTRDKASRGSKAWSAQHAQQAQQPQQPQQVQQAPEQPYEAHEEVVAAAQEAVQANDATAGSSREQAAAVDAAGEAAAAAHVAASEAAQAAPAAEQQQGQQQQQAGLQLSSSGGGGGATGHVAAASLEVGPADPSPPSVPATSTDSSAAQHRFRVGSTAAIAGGVCGTVVLLAATVVTVRIRQRRLAGFRELPTAERLRDELPAKLSPISEQPSAEELA